VFDVSCGVVALGGAAARWSRRCTAATATTGAIRAQAANTVQAPATVQGSEFCRGVRDGDEAHPGRERLGVGDVLTLIGSGLSNAEIAERLFISVATAKTYVTRLLAKLDARDRVHLVIIAYQAGVVTPAP
jgi:DNA-binding NarL/FixJ family response regulator